MSTAAPVTPIPSIPPSILARKKHRDTIPGRFIPKFWQSADRRCVLVREIESRVARMKADTDADSYGKQALCERAVFIISKLETMEREAVEGSSPLDFGSYTQATNCLIGLLKSLGLEKQAKRIGIHDHWAAKVEAPQR